jgi:hypothetical protein
MFCRKVIIGAPQNPAYLDSLGWASYKMGLLVEANDSLAIALSLAPDEDIICSHAREIAERIASKGEVD